jgi:RNA-directed DNA polymerase
MRQVDGAKVTRLTPGGLALLRESEVSRGHSSRRGRLAKGRTVGTEPEANRSMDDGVAEKQAERPERHPRVGGGTAEGLGAGSQVAPARVEESGEGSEKLMEEVLHRENVVRAHARVVRNGGAAGVDGMSVSELLDYCREHWSRIREELLSGRYRPQAVRRVVIAKRAGGQRLLGIPTVLDRMIQQALLQVLQPIVDPTFSDDSYGFRPGRSAHGALKRAQEHIRAGYRWVVDLDLESFFDRVNHDVLMARVASRVKDKRVLKLIRRYLQAGVLEGGVVSVRVEGTPQGGPLSPLLSNILLDEWDKELERRGHRFVRYADDCHVYVRSKRAGERVMDSLERFLGERLRLKVNRSKSAVARPWARTFLGYSFTAHQEAKLRVAPESVKRLRAKLREVFRGGQGRRVDDIIGRLTPIIRGWVGYFRLSEVKGVFEALDGWVRRRLRLVLWRQWKRPRTRVRKLVALGLAPARAWTSAYNGHGPWWNAGASHMNAALPTCVLRHQGLLSFLAQYRRLQCSC